ncbi:flagellar export protein FliJ [Bacillus testis]|uniref:flagellar export protein FliJ n=1 Tax=Bacillus testis TaxID=1622072 RepID=UPI00067ECD99|nr:flagellar export protein FliJ [Bacillus testis]
MGNYSYKFEKILGLKENEKHDAQARYGEAVKAFEIAAEELYRLLKKKEDLHALQQEKLVSGLSVSEIRHNQLFADNLENLISYSQQTVMKARENMNIWQNRLIEKNMEVKKYEKMKEKDFKKFKDHVKAIEKIEMDDVSIQTFLSKEN